MYARHSFSEGKPYLDKVVYKIMGEAAPRDLVFKAKELDATILGQHAFGCQGAALHGSLDQHLPGTRHFRHCPGT